MSQQALPTNLNNFPLVEDDNAIRVPNSGEAVSNDNNSPLRTQPLESFRHHPLTGGVQSAGSLVQY